MPPRHHRDALGLIGDPWRLAGRARRNRSFQPSVRGRVSHLRTLGKERPVADDLDLMRGTLDLFVLKTLSWGPMHGLAIVRWIETVSRAELQVEEGALYPALHRMEQKGWLAADWGISENNRRARFYRLTARGRRQLATNLSMWQRYMKAASLVLSTAPGR
jgi:transcriptional regulator